jgi:hypothetical protein
MFLVFIHLLGFGRVLYFYLITSLECKFMVYIKQIYLAWIQKYPLNTNLKGILVY